MENKSLDYDHMVKILTIGDGSVGKTNLILRFVDNNFKHEYGMTIGVDYKVKTLDIDNFKLKMNIWDTAGQERFKVLVESYYKGADGIFIVYAINNRESFEHVKDWLSQIRNKTKEQGTVIFLIASKCDLESEREISKEEGEELAKELGLEYFAETSSKDDIGVTEAFQEMGKKLKEEFENSGYLYNVDRAKSVLESSKKKKPSDSSKCCK